MLTKRNRQKLQNVKADNVRAQEFLDTFERIINQEWPKATTPEMRMKLEELEISLAKHRQLIRENEALVAKLETPIWKLWKLF